MRFACMTGVLLFGLLGMGCAGGSHYLCDPVWALSPGQARKVAWDLEPGMGRVIQRASLPGGGRAELYRMEAYADGSRWWRVGAWDPGTGLLVRGWATDWPEAGVGGSYPAPADKALLAALRAEFPHAPDAVWSAFPEPPAGVSRVWWKTFERCEPVSPLRFWPAWLLRQFQGALSAAG